MSRQWSTDKPPHRVEVEVRDPDTGRVLRGMAVHGGKGYFPHWDMGHTVYPASAFREWRPVEGEGDR